MAQTYDNCCEECGQDRDSERKLRAMKVAFMNVADLWTDTLVRAERAEYVLASERRTANPGTTDWRVFYKVLHSMVLTLREAAPNTQHAHDLWEEIDRFLNDNPPK